MNIFGQLGCLQNSICYMYLAKCTKYTSWLLFDRTWRKSLVPDGERRWHLNYCPHSRSLWDSCLGVFLEERWLHDDLVHFLRRASEGVDQPWLMDVVRLATETIKKRLRLVLSDIQEMRPFLIKGFKQEKTTMKFGSNLFLAWGWATEFGPASLCVVDSEKGVLEGAATGRAMMSISVSHDGILIDSNQPWLTAETAAPNNGLAVCLYILERFEEKLFTYYDKIDFNRICESVRRPVQDEQDEDSLIAFTCQDLAQGELPPEEE